MSSRPLRPRIRSRPLREFSSVYTTLARTSVWEDLRGLLAQVRRWSQKVFLERRAERARADFWTAVHEGESEAEARSDSR